MDRVVHAAAAREVLDVVVAAVLAGRHRTGTLAADALSLGAIGLPREPVLPGGRQRERWDPLGVLVDQRLLAAVPLGQQVRRRGGAEQPGMRDAGVAHARDVA